MYPSDNIDQATIYQDNSLLKQAADTPYQHSYAYPSPMNSSYNRGLVLGGFSWRVDHTINYTASITPGGSSTTETIELTIYGNFGVYETRFHLLLVDPDSPYIWMTSDCTYPLIQPMRRH
jgi:hypothetical protein